MQVLGQEWSCNDAYTRPTLSLLKAALLTTHQTNVDPSDRKMQRWEYDKEGKDNDDGNTHGAPSVDASAAWVDELTMAGVNDQTIQKS